MNDKEKINPGMVLAKCNDCGKVQTPEEYKHNFRGGGAYHWSLRCNDCYRERGMEGIVVKNPDALERIRDEVKKVIDKKAIDKIKHEGNQ